jgi:hypothetical protein
MRTAVTEYLPSNSLRSSPSARPCRPPSIEKSERWRRPKALDSAKGIAAQPDYVNAAGRNSVHKDELDSYEIEMD